MAQTEIVYSDAINLAELAFRACFEHGVEDEVRTYGMCGNQLRACGSGLVGRPLLVDGGIARPLLSSGRLEVELGCLA